MSLLMDALRKAEEAKRKAAREAESKEAAATPVPEEQQASAGAENSEPAAPAPLELSMEEMDQAPTRAPVPNLETAIEFEDEEDYVLPSSIGSEQASVPDSADKKPEADGVLAGDETIEPEDQASIAAQQDSPEAAIPDQPAKPAVQEEPFAFDDLEFDNESSVEDEAGSSPAPLVPQAPRPEPEPPPPQASPSRVIISRAQTTRKSRSRGESDRRTAQNVFAAKRSPSLGGRNQRIAAGGILFVILIAIGSYFYISLNQESTFNIPAGSYVASEFVDDGFAEDTASEEPGPLDNDAGTAEPADDPLTAPPLEEILAAAEFPEITEEVEPSAASANLQPETIVEEEPALETIATTIGDSTVPAVSDTARDPAPQPRAGESVQRAAATEPTNLISFRRQASVPTMDPNLERAYTAYQSGALDEAEVLYRRALASDPMQRDALLGLATIVARNGGSAEALELYSRLLARNPRDPIARAGLMEIVPAGSPASQEANLKRLLTDYPGVAPLAYAHGNFLASNQRWSEAQQAYFRALQLAKADASVGGQVNPDYAFNLAVSLEHLNQRGPAQNYYREALEFAENHPAGFDIAALRARLAGMTGGDGDD